MKKVGIPFAILLSLPLVAGAQPASQNGSYALHATLAHQANHRILITANSPRPLLQTLTALRREYGWVVDYEAGKYTGVQKVSVGGAPEHPIGGAFQVELPEPRSRTGAEEASILQELVDHYNSSTVALTGQLFSLVNAGGPVRYDIISQSGGPPVLDTLIQLPQATRTIESTIDDICALVSKARGITLDHGGLLDPGLVNTRVTLGGDRPLPARQLLVQALDHADDEMVYVLDYEPSNKHFVIGIRPAVIVEKTIGSEPQVFPVPRASATGP